MTITIDQHLIRTILEWIIIVAGGGYLAYCLLFTAIYVSERIEKYKLKRKRMKYSNVMEAALTYLRNRIRAYATMTEELGSKPSLYIVFNRNRSDFRFQEVFHQIDEELRDKPTPGIHDGWFLLLKGGPQTVCCKIQWEHDRDKHLEKMYGTLDTYTSESLKNTLLPLQREFEEELKRNLSGTKNWVKYY